MTEWILVSCAAVALLAAVFSGAKARLALRARDEAVAAARQAQEILEEFARPTDATEPAPGPVVVEWLVLEPDQGVRWRLRNTSDREVVIEALANPGDFVRRPFDDLPAVIPPQGVTPVILAAVWGHPVPALMELSLRDAEDTVRVAIPPIG